MVAFLNPHTLYLSWWSAMTLWCVLMSSWSMSWAIRNVFTYFLHNALEVLESPIDCNVCMSLSDIQEFYEVSLLDSQRWAETSKVMDIMTPINLWDFSSLQSTTVTSDMLPSLSTSIEVRKWSRLSSLLVDGTVTSHYWFPVQSFPTEAVVTGNLLGKLTSLSSCGFAAPHRWKCQCKNLTLWNHSGESVLIVRSTLFHIANQSNDIIICSKPYSVDSSLWELGCN